MAFNHSSITWCKTDDALNNLFKMLKCTMCNDFYSDPVYLGQCDHVFCRNCVQKKNTCPQCGVMFYTKEIQSARDILETMKLCEELQTQLKSHKSKFASSQGDDSISTDAAQQSNAKNKSSDKLNQLDSATMKTDSTQKKIIGSVPGKSKSVTNQKFDKRNNKGETPLHSAVIKDKMAEVQHLLSHGADCNVKDFAGWTPLHEACHHGNNDMVMILFEHGALINTPGYENNTPLHDAVSNQNIEIVRILLSKGADVAVRNSNGKTPIDMALDEDMILLLNNAKENQNLPAIETSIIQVKGNPIFIYTGLKTSQITKLRNCADLLNGTVLNEYSDQATHLICGCARNDTCTRTIKFMKSILSGKWILSYSWVESSLQSNNRVDEDEFEVHGVTKCPNSKAPTRARLNFSKKFPGLFDGCSFFFQGNFDKCNLDKDELTDLIKSGGGIILNRQPKPDLSSNISFPFHAVPGSTISSGCYIIYNEMDKRRENKKMSVLRLPVSWLLDCISSFSLVEPAE